MNSFEQAQKSFQTVKNSYIKSWLYGRVKMMINIMKPEYFIPVNGEFKMQIAHAKLANEAGVQPEKYS